MRIVPTLGKLAFTGFVLSALLGLTAGFGTRLGFWTYHIGLDVLLPWCVYVAIAALAIGIVWGLLAWFGKGDGATAYGLIGVFGAALVLALPIYDYYSIQNSPPIHDITTDIANPPHFRALLALRKGSPNSARYDGNSPVAWHGKTRTVAQWQRKYYTDIYTLRLLMSPAQLYARALKAAQQIGWDIVAQSPEEGRIEATDTSFLFGLVDDIVIRVRPSGAGAKVDIRSESRVGRNDGGRNADAIRSFIRIVKHN